jgi:putative iron-regulated protein
MKKLYIGILILASLLSTAVGCGSDNENGSSIDNTLNETVLTDFSEKVVQSSYEDLKDNAAQLYTNILALEGDRSDGNLLACRNSWKAARQAWEQTESFLFGPVSTENIDPRIDTWPVNFEDLQSQLNSGNEFTEEYIGNLEDALKGFHPIEYLIFGQDGDKVADDLTDRDLEYLKGLGLNLKKLTTEVSDQWDAASSDSYYHTFITAGKGSTTYTTQRAAFEEMVNAMANICEEVANGKIHEVYLAQDASLEESPFAKNSITDFTNNIKGVQNAYLSKYTSDGRGLEDLVRKYNLSLDAEIKTNISAAITSLNSVTVPFGEAIISQPTQIQNAVAAINALKETLESKLLPFVQQHSK